MMKKILLGTTAIVGASVLLASAAQAEKPKLSMSGNVKFEAGFVDRGLAGFNRGYHFYTDDAEIVFRASSTADNGLEYGAKIEYEFEGSSTDEAMIWLEGDWGLIQMGNEDGAEDAVKTGGWSTLGGTGGWDGENLFTKPGAALFGPTTVGDSSDGTKISYFTPSFNGFRAGVSLTPDTGHSYDASYDDTSGDADDAGDSQNNIGIGIEHKGSAGSIGWHVSGRYVTAEYEGTGSPSDPSYEDVNSFAVGAKLTYEGFSFAVGYGDNDNSGVSKFDSAYGVDAGKWMDVGVGYASGPYAIGAGFYHSEVSQASGTSDAEVDQFAVTADYTIVEGLGVYAEYDYVDIDVGGTASDNEASVFIVGTKVSF